MGRSGTCSGETNASVGHGQGVVVDGDVADDATEEGVIGSTDGEEDGFSGERSAFRKADECAVLVERHVACISECDDDVDKLADLDEIFDGQPAGVVRKL